MVVKAELYLEAHGTTLCSLTYDKLPTMCLNSDLSQKQGLRHQFYAIKPDSIVKCGTQTRIMYSQYVIHSATNLGTLYTILIA